MDRIRTAVAADVEAIADLADHKRRQYAEYEPVFWRPAEDAVDRHRDFLAGLIADNNVIVLVNDDSGTPDGFITARLVPAPPVYRPGGDVCLIDDFAVRHIGDWPTVGVALLRAAAVAAAARGAVHAVVVAGHLDAPKRDALASAGLRVGTEWWMVGLPLAPDGT